ARHLTGPLRQLVGEARRLGSGDLESPIQGSDDDASPAEIVALGGAMEEMRVRLYALNRDREEYLFAVAHELKTPLSALAASVRGSPVRCWCRAMAVGSARSSSTS